MFFYLKIQRNLSSIILFNLVVAGFYENLFKADENLLSKMISESYFASRGVIQSLEMKMANVPRAKTIKSPYEQFFHSLKTTMIHNSHQSIGLKYLTWFSYSLIIMNCLTLCFLLNYSMRTAKILNYIDFAMVVLFYLEISMKVFIFKKTFFKNVLNVVDFCLFLVNISAHFYYLAINQSIFSDIHTDMRPYFLIRSLHFWRIFTLFKWKNISILLVEISDILIKLKDLFAILLIFMILFTLIGKDLFKLTTKPNEHNVELERLNFNNIWNAFLSNYLIFMAEEWHIIMFAHIKQFTFASGIYFVANLIFCSLLLSKIFLASLINKLIESKNMQKFLEEHLQPVNHSFLETIKIVFKSFISKLTVFLSKLRTAKIENHKDFQNISRKFLKLQSYTKKLFTSKYFNKFMIFIIFSSFMTLVLEDPYSSPNGAYNLTLKFLDIPLFIVFVLEYFLSVISNENRVYSWENIQKLAICSIYLFHLVFDLSFLKFLFLLRLFQIMSFSKELKVALKALLQSLMDIFRLLFISLVFCVGFALVGIVYFKGSYWFCSGLNEHEIINIIKREDCFDYGGDWINKDFNFDNFFKGVEIMFVIANTEGWLPLM